MTELDHTTIEQAIEALLEANTTLYDSTSVTGTKLINIEEGLPLTNDLIPQLLPACYITLESETLKNKGSLTSNVMNVIEHDIRYKIRIAVSDIGAKESEDLLNDFQKQILDILEDNNKLSNNVDSCFPERISRVEESAHNRFFARDIILHCIKTTN
jgi:hypothetical protein